MALEFEGVNALEGEIRKRERGNDMLEMSQLKIMWSVQVTWKWKMKSGGEGYYCLDIWNNHGWFFERVHVLFLQIRFGKEGFRYKSLHFWYSDLFSFSFFLFSVYKWTFWQTILKIVQCLLVCLWDRERESRKTSLQRNSKRRECPGPCLP